MQDHKSKEEFLIDAKKNLAYFSEQADFWRDMVSFLQVGKTKQEHIIISPPFKKGRPALGTQTFAEAIEEILKKEDRPLTAGELAELAVRKGRHVGKLKDFASQLNTARTTRQLFDRQVIDGISRWALPGWFAGSEIRLEYKKKIRA